MSRSSSSLPSVENPVVFQCARCRSIISDSFHLIDSDGEAILLFSHVHGVDIGDELIVAANPKAGDHACNYVELFCQGSCRAVLGRFYKTTVSGFDHFRDRFAINVECLTSYELGTAAITGGDAGPRVQGLNELYSLMMVAVLALQERIEKLEENKNSAETEKEKNSKSKTPSELKDHSNSHPPQAKRLAKEPGEFVFSPLSSLAARFSADSSTTVAPSKASNSSKSSKTAKRRRR